MHEKKTFSGIFILLIVMLVSLPFLTTFQDILTRIVMSFSWYKALQDFVVPYEMRVILSVLSLLHVSVAQGVNYVQLNRGTESIAVRLIWNCVGWQSIILFLITLLTGFSGRFTFSSKLEAFCVGILGTYLINMFRLVLVMLMYYALGKGPGIIFHDYFSSILSIAWLFVFWWISYTFILEKRELHIAKDIIVEKN